MKVLRTVADVRAAVSAWRNSGARIGLVPTMGALHEGHLSLVMGAGQACDHVVVSLFVNPTQFGPSEDYAVYPRDEERDAQKLRALGVDVVFAPTVEEMYPKGFATSVKVRGLTERLCGAVRPVHFEGVATVVTKLLLQVMPDAAFFGEKDYQQLQVIRRLVRDLDIPVHIVGLPTVRESDGLALSSRNTFLSASERAAAPALHRTLAQTAARLLCRARPGEQTIGEELTRARDALSSAGFTRIDYLELCDAETLAPAADLARPARLLAAVWLGRTRLIDNEPVGPRP
ncbi:MAG: pantoate--beta-alanine ligase [Alphaproteobacteria bacterium]